MLDKVNGTLDTTDKGFNITAALATPHMRSVRSLLASADIAPSKPMSLKEIDDKLRHSRLNLSQRFSVKVALERSGLIAA
jgi:hypothetical protein